MTPNFAPGRAGRIEMDRANKSRAAESTEDRNPRTRHIAHVSTLHALQLINAEDRYALDVVTAALPQLAAAVDAMYDRYRAGATLHYFGAGTSGRLCVLDAAEIPPTYGVSDTRFRAHIAGGASAMTTAVEDAEDSADAAAAVVTSNVRPGDIVVAVAASGRTPFAVGAVETAQAAGALTIAVTCAAGSPLETLADYAITIPTGAEAITGSTRMKAATAQKVVLHSMSTTLMVKAGATVSNLMVGVEATNAKLRRRTTLMLQQATGCNADQAAAALDSAQGNLRAALTSRGGNQGPAGVAGVDAGGTGLRLWLDYPGPSSDAMTAQADGRFTATALATYDGEPLLHHLANLLDGAHPERIGVALAGARSYPADAQVVAAAIARRFGAQVHIFDDGYVQCRAAHGPEAGAVLAVGTGAVAVRLLPTGEVLRSDGLGFEAGDFGSGARIGAEAVRQAVRSLTGRGPIDAALQQCFLDHFGSVEQFHQVIARTPASTVLAGFAAPFLRLARRRHHFAVKVSQQAATDLVTTLLQVVGDDHIPVTLSGGVVSESSPVGVQVRAAVTDRGLHLVNPRIAVERAAAQLVSEERSPHHVVAQAAP